jgi:hypothetical protein
MNEQVPMAEIERQLESVLATHTQSWGNEDLIDLATPEVLLVFKATHKGTRVSVRRHNHKDWILTEDYDLLTPAILAGLLWHYLYGKWNKTKPTL